MKLPIKKKYFDMIKSGTKTVEFRDSHITFICEETGETIRKEVNRVFLIRRNTISPELNDMSCFDDDILIGYDLVDKPEKPLERDLKKFKDMIKWLVDLFITYANRNQISLG